jgi:hypothetical protein
MQKKDDRQHGGACRKHHRHGLRDAPERHAPSRAAGILHGHEYDSSEPEAGQQVAGHQQGSPRERRLPKEAGADSRHTGQREDLQKSRRGRRKGCF